MQYRVGYDNGPLKLSDLHIDFSHMGGKMCYDLQYEIPDIKCQVCGRNSMCLIQYVSQKSSDSLHRIVYVFLCNSAHYRDSIRVLTYNKNIIVPEKDTSVSVTAPTWEEDIDMNNLLGMTAQMQTAAPAPAPNVFKQNTPLDPIEFKVRKQNTCLEPHDIFTENTESKMNDFFQGAVDVIMDGENTKFTDVLLTQFNGACFIAGYDRNPLSFQKCISKLFKGQFEEDKYKLNRNFEEAEEAEEIEVINDNGPDVSIDDKCDCKFCKEFHQKYVHEMDLFSTMIWVLKMDQSEESAEFKAIYVFGSRNLENGIHEGCAVAMDDDEDVKELLKELKKKKEKEEAKKLKSE
ncbi:Conserved_hypothetical protein [Hexamita inflata]|uniref:Uncharacterized protein n=1 Tax=Hexamita inflata TaxID=28002 RepID=A0AA86QWG0_9EUKA|nr:Conserved hypothetical protein [Hexamita inflata]